MVEDTILYLLHNLFFGEAFHWIFQYITFKLTFSLSFSQYFSLFIKFFSISWIIPVIYSAIYLYFPGLQFILVFSYFIQMLFHVFFDFFNSSNMFITVFFEINVFQSWSSWGQLLLGLWSLVVTYCLLFRCLELGCWLCLLIWIFKLSYQNHQVGWQATPKYWS